MQAGSRASLAAAREQLDTVTASAAPAAVASLTEQLFAVVHVLQAEPRLRRALTDTSAQPAQKVALVRRLFGSQLGAEALAVVDALVSSRWSSARDLLEATDTLAA